MLVQAEHEYERRDDEQHGRDDDDDQPRPRQGLLFATDEARALDRQIVRLSGQWLARIGPAYHHDGADLNWISHQQVSRLPCPGADSDAELRAECWLRDIRAQLISTWGSHSSTVAISWLHNCTAWPARSLLAAARGPWLAIAYHIGAEQAHGGAMVAPFAATVTQAGRCYVRPSCVKNA